jgi:hypothetical protein
VQAVIEARDAKKLVQGVAATELHERGWTWAQIGHAIGVDQSTAYLWARTYLNRP